MQAVSNFFAAVAAFFGWKRESEARANTAPMQARAQGNTDQEIKDQARADIKSGNVDQLRRDLAE